MNTPNNKRKKESQNKIEKVFVELIQKKEINEISVTDICKLTKINRTTFYNNYLDIYDLANKIKEKLEQDVLEIYKEEREKKYSSHDFSKILYLIKENPLFFKTFFKLGFDSSNLFEYDKELSKLFYNDEFIDYHIEFFRAGFNAIVKKWLYNDCKESVEDICKILKEEYAAK